MALMGTGKKEAWDAITQAINMVSPEIRTVAKVKKSGLTWSTRPKEEFQFNRGKKTGVEGRGHLFCLPSMKEWLQLWDSQAWAAL